MPESLSQLLETFAAEARAKLQLPGSGEPEDQLRAPLEGFLKSVGAMFGMTVVPKGEVRVRGVGRPDYAVYCNGALCGHVELKQPGKGVEPSRYRGHDRDQWERFKSLPNVLYTDGEQWRLFQSGEAVGAARLPGGLAAGSAEAVGADAAASFEPLLREFLTWNPVVPGAAAELAKLLAPLCRLLRQEVAEAMGTASSPFQMLLGEWRSTLFPGASEEAFADAYAQTVTFALLLARAGGGDTLDLREAEQALASEHALLSKALKIFTDNLERDEKPLSLGVLQRITASIPSGGWKTRDRDPWLYFYEYFLAEYDPQLRKDAGVYYTPVQIVQAMVRLTEDLLVKRLGKPMGFASSDVMTLDPAAGTGTFLLGIISHTLAGIAEAQGAGAAASYAEALGRQLHGFETLVGPYAVAQLRVSRALAEHGAGAIPGGPRVFLTDTLESPDLVQEFPSLLTRELSEQHRRALKIKKSTPVLVCLGNPPYDRHEAGDAANRKATGGWVRWGDEDENGQLHPEQALLAAFSAPVKAAGQGGQLKNLYNLYVYFWRWALWKVFEQGAPDAPGVVAFITASSFLDGPAFCGMREELRRQCHDIWILDLGGEGRGSRKEENVFNIQTPVAITLALRTGPKAPDAPGAVHYARIRGDREAKLHALAGIQSLDSRQWEPCPTGWQDKFRPQGTGAYFESPLLTDLLPWQHSGIQFKRTWPIAPDKETLEARWQKFSLSGNRAQAFKETRDRKVDKEYPDIFSDAMLPALSSLSPSVASPILVEYGYRSFDRQFCFLDNRLGDFLRPPLLKCQSDKQLFFASLFTQPLSVGPALTVSAAVPDLHYFSGRGAKDIIPLYRDAAATQPNLLPGLLELLAAAQGQNVLAEDFAAYVYGVLAHAGFTRSFHAELGTRELRVPLTRDPELFRRAVRIGRRLIWLHSYGERMVPPAELPGAVPSGSARCLRAVPGTPEEYPERFEYVEASRTLHVGQGEFAPVEPEVFGFEVSGLQVVRSWLKYRMREGAGKKSSPLDDIRPQRWTAEFTSQLLNLLWVLEATVAEYPQQEELLERILAGPLVLADELPTVPEQMRQPPGKAVRKAPTQQQGSLFG